MRRLASGGYIEGVELASTSCTMASVATSVAFVRRVIRSMKAASVRSFAIKDAIWAVWTAVYWAHSSMAQTNSLTSAGSSAAL